MIAMRVVNKINRIYITLSLSFLSLSTFSQEASIGLFQGFFPINGKGLTPPAYGLHFFSTTFEMGYIGITLPELSLMSVRGVPIARSNYPVEAFNFFNFSFGVSLTGIIPIKKAIWEPFVGALLNIPFSRIILDSRNLGNLIIHEYPDALKSSSQTPDFLAITDYYARIKSFPSWHVGIELTYWITRKYFGYITLGYIQGINAILLIDGDYKAYDMEGTRYLYSGEFSIAAPLDWQWVFFSIGGGTQF